jgi:hypothetical protein
MTPQTFVQKVAGMPLDCPRYILDGLEAWAASWLDMPENEYHPDRGRVIDANNTVALMGEIRDPNASPQWLKNAKIWVSGCQQRLAEYYR